MEQNVLILTAVYGFTNFQGYRIEMILPREFSVVYEDSQIFNTFFTFQISQLICLVPVIKDTNLPGRGKTFLIRAEDRKIC